MVRPGVIHQPAHERIAVKQARMRAPDIRLVNRTTKKLEGKWMKKNLL